LLYLSLLYLLSHLQRSPYEMLKIRVVDVVGPWETGMPHIRVVGPHERVGELLRGPLGRLLGCGLLLLRFVVHHRFLVWRCCSRHSWFS